MTALWVHNFLNEPFIAKAVIDSSIHNYIELGKKMNSNRDNKVDNLVNEVINSLKRLSEYVRDNYREESKGNSSSL